MARRVIATAAVSIDADPAAFDRKLKDIDRELRNHVAFHGTITERISDLWAQAGREMSAFMDAEMERIERSMRELTGEADRYGELITDHFKESAVQSWRWFDHYFREMGPFADLANEANVKGELITDHFKEAARQSERAFEQHLNDEVFDQVVRAANVAGERITGHFREAARQSERHLAGLNLMGAGGWLKAAATAGATLAAGESVRFGLDFTSSLEKAQARFRGLTESEAEALDMYERLVQYAIDTPFSLPAVADLSAQLVAVGKDFGVTTQNVTEYMDTIGNGAAALGLGEDAMKRVVNALGQMSGSGRVLSQDMNQLKDALPGYNAWKVLADGLGTTEAHLREMGRQGTLTEFVEQAGGVEVAIGLILDGMKEIPGAAGAMERQMGTLAGVFEKFRDEVGVAMSEGLAPFVATLKSVMSSEEVLGSIGRVAEAFGGVLTRALNALEPHLMPIMDTFGRLLEHLTPLAGLLDPIALLFGVLLRAIEPIVMVIGQFAEQLSGPLTRAIEALQPVLDTLGMVLAETLSDALIALMPLFEALVDVIVALSPLLPPLVELIVAFATTGLTLLVAIMPVATKLLELLAKAIEKIAQPLANIAEKVVDFVEKVVGWFQKLYNVLVGNSIIPDLVNEIARWFNILWDTAKFIWNAIKTAIIDPIQAVWNWLANTAWPAIRSTAQTAWNTLRSTAETVWRAIRAAIIDPIQAAWDWLVDTWNRITGWLSGVWEGVRGGAATAWAGIKSAIVGPIEEAWQRISQVVDWIKGKIDAAIGWVGDLIGAVNKIPGAGVAKNIIGGIGSIFSADGRIVTQPMVTAVGEGYKPEVIIPLTKPARALELMRETGLDRLAARVGGPGIQGPLVSMPGAVIQNATDVDFMAQQVNAALIAVMAA